MNLLDDQTLEDVNLIKKVDTLAIIRQAQMMKAKQQKKWMWGLIGLCFIVCLLAQLVYFYVFGVKWILFLFGGIYFVFAMLLILLRLLKGDC